MGFYKRIHGGHKTVCCGAACLTAAAGAAHTVANNGEQDAGRVFLDGEIILVDIPFHANIGFTAVLQMDHLRLDLQITL